MNCAMNRLSRPLSLPDRQSPSGKKKYVSTLSRRESGLSPVCFWGRRPGCNPPSVLSSICLIGEPAPPAEDHRRLLPLSHRCRDPFHPQLPIFHRRSPGEGMSSSSRPGKVSFLRPRTGSHLAPLTITTVSAMWVEFPQDHHQWPCNCSPARRLSQQGSEKCCAERLRTDIAPNVDSTWAQHLVRLGI